MRRFVVLLVALLAGALFTGGVTSAASAADAGASAKKNKQKKKKKSKAVRPTVKVLNLNATQLAAGKAKVQVRANKGAKVRLTGTTWSFDTGNRQLFKPRTISLGKKRAKTVSLNIAAAVKSSLASCQARSLTVKAVNGKRKSSRKQNVVRNQADCQLSKVDLSRADECDFIAQPKEGMCMLPFPNDFYTVSDPDNPTGKRIHFTEGAMPQNKDGVSINHSKYDESDGFSQGVGAVVRIPGLDSLYRVDADRSVARIRGGVTIANAIAFAPDGRTLYFTDTRQGAIERAEYDPATGAVGAWSVLAPPEAAPGRPDGATLDAEGFLWNARYGGACLARFAPDGRLDRIVALPVSQPTACAFGGDRLRTLFVTTARQRLSEAQLAAEPLSGSLLALDVGVAGLPEPRYAG